MRSLYRYNLIPKRIGFFCQEKEEKGQGIDQTWKELLKTLQQFFFGLYLGSQTEKVPLILSDVQVTGDFCKTLQVNWFRGEF